MVEYLIGEPVCPKRCYDDEGRFTVSVTR